MPSSPTGPGAGSAPDARASGRLQPAAPDSAGVAMVLGCYLLWGFFPLFFRMLSAAGSVEIIGHRVVWTLMTCLVLIAATRRWRALWEAVTAPRLLASFAACGMLVSLNWLVYVYGVNTGRTADAALGYFINPLVTVALAALVLGERLSRTQAVCLALAGSGVAVLVVAQGSLPWISLALALTFGFYGLVKKRVGARVDALTGLCAETAAVVPVALAYLGWLAWQGQAAVQGPQASLQLGVLLVVAGPVTAVPLLLFAAGARRVPLSMVGISQYLGPIIQFLLAWLVLHEEIAPARWAAMVLVWLAVVLLMADLARPLMRRPRPQD